MLKIYWNFVAVLKKIQKCVIYTNIAVCFFFPPFSFWGVTVKFGSVETFSSSCPLKLKLFYINLETSMLAIFISFLSPTSPTLANLVNDICILGLSLLSLFLHKGLYVIYFLSPLKLLSARSLVASMS